MTIESECEIDRNRCPVCGVKTNSESTHCSVSCALAARIPLGKTELPATWELFSLLASCFVLFNQILLWSLGLAKVSLGDIILGQNLLTVSIVAGILWLGAVVLAWVRSSPKLLGDYLVGLFGLLVLVIPFEEVNLSIPLASRLGIANLLISTRLYRGVFYLWRTSKKREK